MQKIVVLLMSLVLGAACFTGCTNNGEAFTEKSYTAESKEMPSMLSPSPTAVRCKAP